MTLTPAHLVAVLAAASLFAGLGWIVQRELATGGYRIPEDAAVGSPGRSWWPPPAMAALAAYLTVIIPAQASWTVLPAWLLLAWLTVALVWIDLDVHRLPVGLVWPASAAMALLVGVALLDQGRARVGSVVGGVALFTVIYGVLWLLPGGGLGMGDLRLAPLLGGLLGTLGWAEVGVGLALGFLLGGLAALVLLLTGRAGAKTPLAFGPAMCLGTLLAAGGAHQILGGLFSL